ncbi:MAG: hypothetical protein JXR77_06385 [Lentisphaeria bacterium]|nr:hypothetical protein [Lentisphaeria bacterium]
MASREAMGGAARAAGRFFLVLFCQAGLGAASPESLVPLRSRLPKPAFVGTPQHVISANLERPSGKLREPFLVPADAANLALGKAVTGSDREPVLGRYEYATDGDKEADGDSFLEMGPGRQWVQIDLGRRCRVDAILVWHYHSEARAYRDVVIQIADDPEMAEGVRTLFNNDHDNSSGLGAGTDREYIETFEGRLIPVPAARARYVRLYSNGSTTDDMNHLVEVEVHGAPVP